jgi:hypothetical protein
VHIYKSQDKERLLEKLRLVYIASHIRTLASSTTCFFRSGFSADDTNIKGAKQV